MEHSLEEQWVIHAEEKQILSDNTVLTTVS